MNKRRQIVRELDNISRKILFVLEHGKCYIGNCQRPATDRAHLITCGRMHTRWDTDPSGNCHLLCRECHSADHAGTLRPSYVELFIDRQGEAAFERLQLRSNDNTKITEEEMEFILDIHIEFLENMAGHG